MRLKNEINIFLTALLFYTRIPCPAHINHDQKSLDESTRYFPLIGWIVGGVAAIVFVLSEKIFPLSISILISMASTIFLTGAFHEDGFADSCDGLGGGWNKQQVLDIMKDSRIGSYGAIGLVFILLCKFLSLSSIDPAYIPLILIIGHSLSRLAVNVFRFTSGYVRENEDAKAKPMAKKITLENLSIGAIFGLLPVFFLPLWCALVLMGCALLAQWLWSRYVVKRIGGYTGDCLGATQQICEIVIYLGFSVLWKFI